MSNGHSELKNGNSCSINQAIAVKAQEVKLKVIVIDSHNNEMRKKDLKDLILLCDVGDDEYVRYSKQLRELLLLCQ